MRAIPPGMAAKIAAGATSFCRLWKLARPDGLVLGFTDHDRDLTVSGLTYAAASGLDGTEAETQLGLGVSGAEVAGALTSAEITEADIAAGRWDGASVETWLCDWENPLERVLLDAGHVGEIRRNDRSFEAELRGLTHLLDQDKGRIFQSACAAALGDARCGINLALPAHRVLVTVSATDGRLLLSAPGAGAFAAGFFDFGMAEFITGANAGLKAEIKRHSLAAGVATVTLWSAPSGVILAGDQIALTAGCDKTFGTCLGKFANTANFRGFPHIPGNDFALSYARQGEPGQDGGSLTP